LTNFRGHPCHIVNERKEKRVSPKKELGREKNWEGYSEIKRLLNHEGPSIEIIHETKRKGEKQAGWERQFLKKVLTLCRKK